MNSTTLVAIVKDERPYLIEWVAYHRLIGFDRIRVYSNDCSDGTDELLDRMQEVGLVEHYRWPSQQDISAQRSAYADTLNHCKTRWIMALDADEFLNLARDDSIGSFLDRFDDDVSAVAICWRVFGSGGQLWRGPQPVLQRFTQCAAEDHHLSRHIKTISKAEDVEVVGVHAATLKRGNYVLADGEPCKLHRNNFAWPRYEAAKVNHYVTRSRGEFEDKVKRGSANRPLGHPSKWTSRPPSFFDEHDRNEEFDRSIQRHLPALKEEIRRISQLLACT